jgi:hypothetical protein
MKKVFLLSIVLSMVCAIHAQTQFSVPTPTAEEKANTNKMLMNNNLLALITVAKNEGMTAEEFGKKTGAVFAPNWDENTSFEQFVNFNLYSWACMIDGVQIIEQSNEKIVIKAPSLYQRLDEQGVVLGTSAEEYTEFFNAMLSVIADHLGCSYELTKGEDGYKMVITK